MRDSSTALGFGPFRLEMAERRLWMDGLPVHLTPKAFDVLCLLVRQREHLVTKKQLLEEVWPDTFVGDAVLTRCVADLRKALGESAADATYIETVTKQGYRFREPVRELTRQTCSDAHRGRRGLRIAAALLLLALPAATLWSMRRGPEVATHGRAPRAPEGWIMGGSTPRMYETGIDTSVRYTGRASGVLRSAAGSPDALGTVVHRVRHAFLERFTHDAPADHFGTMMQIVRGDAYRRGRFRLRGHLRSRDVTVGAGLWMRVDAADRRSIAYDNMAGRWIRGTSDWTPHAIVLDVPSEATLISFGVLLIGSGEVWADELGLEAAGLEVETTAINVQPTLAKIVVRENTPTHPVNLGFEADLQAARTP